MTRSTTFVAFCFTLLLLAIAGEPSVAGGDEKTIVGRWDFVSYNGVLAKDNAVYFRFNKDGTFTSSGVFANSEGKYKFLSNKVIEFDEPGILYGRRKNEIKYRIEKDNLIFTIPPILGNGAADMVFKRVDSGK